MTSFAVRIEPRPDARLAAAAFLLHGAAAVLPWVARCPAGMAALLSFVALAGLAHTLGRVPGPHGALRRVVLQRAGWRVRLAGECGDRPAELGRGTRAYAGLVVLDFCVAGRRRGWLLTRRAVPPVAFRHLKARIRLA